MGNKIRLNKFLARAGVASRRNADKLIKMGKISVNGIVVRELGIMVDPDEDQIFIGGAQVKMPEDMVYYLLNKPVGCVSTSFDPLFRKKVVDLVPEEPRVFSVGRLDYNTCGLLILTNDGDFANRLIHPRYDKEKEYLVGGKILSEGLSADKILSILKTGVDLDEGVAKADSIKMIEQDGKVITFSMVIHQGWNRQIRRMCEKAGLEVIILKRIRIGELKLGSLEEGSYRELGDEEVYKLLR